MAGTTVTLTLRVPSSHKLNLYAALKEISVAEAAQEAIDDWFNTIGAARLECAIDREIAEITALLDGTPSVQILPPDERVIN